MPESRIFSVPIEEEMQSSYLDYAMSVIVGRALPDVRDGLKPVHRRILYAMHEIGLHHNRPYKKSATVVGEVLGKYHPHGDAAVYDTLVRMAQDFSMRYPLIDGQGNFGSIDGDAAAAYRYTEARLSKIAEELLRDIDKDTVDFVPNFDEKLKEPVVLPAGFPNLLANGSSGIAVGMATNIPPHNLNELINALIYIIDNPDAELDDIMKFIKGPDFPTGAIIMGVENIRKAYETGNGSIIVESAYHIEEGKRGKNSIVITEIPYQVNKASLIMEIAALVKTGKVVGISDIRDESNRDGIRIVLELKQGAQIRVILNKLLLKTKLRTSYGINLLALVDGVPRRLSLLEMLKLYLEHRRVVVERRSRFLLEKAERRAHIIEGLRKALDHIDEIINIIRSSKDVPTAKSKLIKRFEFSEEQAQAILDMKLSRLTGLERKALEEEYAKLIQEIERLKSILGSKAILDTVVKEELERIKKEFGDPRRTRIMKSLPEKLEERDLIREEDVVVTVTHNGWIKRMPLSTYRAQGRGGRGVLGMDQGEDDFVQRVFVASTHDRMLIFTDRGICYGIDVFELPEGSRVSRGKPILQLINIPKGEQVRGVVCERDLKDIYIIMVTKNGTVKKLRGGDLRNAHRSGIRAMGVVEGDELIDVSVLRGGEDIMLVTGNGMVIRFPEAQVRPMGRSAKGVRGARLKKGDHIVSVIIPCGEPHILFVTENGYGKRTPVDEFRKIGRGGMGVIGIKLSEKTGGVVGAISSKDDDQLIIITIGGKILRMKVKETRIAHRSASGVKMINLLEGDRVADVAKIPAGEEG